MGARREPDPSRYPRGLFQVRLPIPKCILLRHGSRSIDHARAALLLEPGSQRRLLRAMGRVCVLRWYHAAGTRANGRRGHMRETCAADRRRVLLRYGCGSRHGARGSVYVESGAEWGL
jgi:hypothetical protein